MHHLLNVLWSIENTVVLGFIPSFQTHDLFLSHLLPPLQNSSGGFWGLYGFSIFLKGSCSVRSKRPMNLQFQKPALAPLHLTAENRWLHGRAGSEAIGGEKQGRNRFCVWKLEWNLALVFYMFTWPYITTTEASRSEWGLQSMWPFLPEKNPSSYQCINNSFGRDSSSQAINWFCHLKNNFTNLEFCT